ncbi:TPA: hypothetical protein TUW61_000361 [Streptococcus equi subsp. zooepidemicus]|uniref:Uncharacterized protein n=3 Tax=Streptococcus equi TaxID=1336 RepID=A0A922NWA9_9STRE|nr:hypothetical protein [Streptococcus equi]ACG61999.1 hypothetical protein Sez_0632 [Streptococcus equi subsp. zooepidemicus MGCS10565]KED05136.1 hypothetical protein CECT5772_01998 [Streptococcus equi subsp. ruminatorum CECT 5772]KIS20917.1 membrane protein [Streptococcus equi subsp. zooepidemicus Sz35]MCD3386625.1 hypothetical protein [Streptococcus equi subsp. zooepidemicus]MCD3390576.1 hypothetical protein [Streptococcus equi subsp. zooepidemicus]
MPITVILGLAIFSVVKVIIFLCFYKAFEKKQLKKLEQDQKETKQAIDQEESKKAFPF